MEFKTAKRIIRAELAMASNEKLAEVLDAARAGEMPWIECGACLAGKLSGSESWWDTCELSFMGCGWQSVSDAYYRIGYPCGLDDRDEEDEWDDATDDTRRQRVLTHMVLAEIRQRMRLADATEVSSISELMTGVRK